MENNQQITLSELPVNKLAEVCRVVNQSEEMLELLQLKKINIGTRLEVKRKFNFDRSIEIKLRQQPAFSISDQLAKNIFVTL
jgi:DtxR family transcriptional regulator, Mn-dependent transcriptional regulator